MSDLCTECGLCCDGTLFDSVELYTADDVNALSSLSAVFVQRPDSVRVQQPCPALADRCCSVYDSRPATCRSFECDVLRAHDRGDLSLDAARQLIARAVQLSAQVRPPMEALVAPPAGLHELARRAGLAEVRSATPLRRSSFPKLLTDVQAHLRAMPDEAAAVAQHSALLDDAGELYTLLVESFGLGGPTPAG